ncbi:protein kinase [Sorangium cellulosum]|uniref:non-specific serine/threonine protein kinase n=1 Tax=Sorangium cellulosum TaxID=56 RepID=A0A2L0ESP6_SORCE|nr:BREX system serine/threonine kinase PglW [Sorangium cellulosum]AUX42290.1 protein kinase [Sorangium cellulosum]
MLSPERVALQGLTPHPHEQDAIEFVKKELPDSHPYRVWALFDLVDLSGRRYEIDLLVLGYDALYHIEMKGHPGRVSGDVVDWKFTFPDGGVSVRENPSRLADHKSRVLGSLLDRHLGPGRPYVETLVFLTHPEVKVDLQGAARSNVITRRDFLRAVQYGDFPGANPSRRRAAIDKPTARAMADALKAIGIRPSAGSLKLGSLVLGGLVEEGPGYQDRVAKDERIAEIRRRARSYLVPQSPTAERREQLRRAAEREAKLLTVLGDHPGILKLTQYEAEGPTGGPCLVFEHFEDARPLDAFLRQRPDVTFEQKLQILEQVSDALAYCHRKKVLHRGLCPGAVLVRERPDGKGLETKLYNFQLATRSDGSQGTIHLSQLGPERALVYRAPEVVDDPARAREESDIFSLGALAYFVLTGRPPGATLQERQALFDAGGGRLSIAAVSDALAPGAVPADGVATDRRRSLDEEVGYATAQSYLDRPDSAVDWMALVLDAATAPEAPPPAAEPQVDPLEARPQQILPGGIEVVKHLGTGSTARVLRVRRDGSEYALKVSRAPELDERLRAEARALDALRGDRIVSLKETLSLGDRLCLLLEDAGETLADILAKEGPQSLDYARRWGEDLLLALRELESRHVLHRDIKPANLGVPSSAAKRTRNLFLFDFSLAGLDLREIAVGTPAYRDPFLVTRKQWDEAADRYSAAVTLYEMLTGSRPAWSSGDVPATASDAEMIIEAERFDASVRDRLLAFFRKCFARDAAQRHDSAEGMRAEWLACFLAPAEARPTAQPTAAVDYAALADSTPIQALPLSARALNALDRSGVITVRDVLGLPTNQLSAIRGVGRDTAREIVGLIKALHESRKAPPPREPEFFPEYRGEDAPLGRLDGVPPAVTALLEGAGFTTAAEVAQASEGRIARVLARATEGVSLVRAALAKQRPPPGAAPPTSLEDFLDRFLPSSNKRGHAPFKTARELFGLDPVPGGAFVSSAGELARKRNISRQGISLALGRAREAWRAEPSWPALVALVEGALATFGGAASAERLAAALLDALPHQAQLGDVARRAAVALVRVVAEARPEIASARLERGLWLGVTPEHLSLARALGQRADALAAREPLPSFDQVREALGEVVKDSPLASLGADRLVAMAAEASKDAAASARLELYPRGLDAERALRLSAGALPAARISPEQVRRTVAVRYPEAAPLPDDGALADLLAPLGLELRDGFFERPSAFAASTAHTERLSTRKPTLQRPLRPTTDPKQQEKSEFHERIRSAARRRAFRVLEVAAANAGKAAEELSRVLGSEPISLEREILRTLDEVVREHEIEDPSVIGDTDRKGPDGSADWAMLTDLVEESASRVVGRLVTRTDTLLLTQPGLLARYKLDRPLHALLQATQRDDGPGIFLLVPSYSEPSAAPVIDAPTGPLPIPLSSPAQRLRIPDAWITND